MAVEMYGPDGTLTWDEYVAQVNPSGRKGSYWEFDPKTRESVLVTPGSSGLEVGARIPGWADVAQYADSGTIVHTNAWMDDKSDGKSDDNGDEFESDDNFRTLKQGFLQAMVDIGLDTATTNELWGWVKGRFIADSTFTSAQAMIEVYDQKAFKDRFPGIALMREDKRYLSAPRDIPTPAEYLERERTLARQLEHYGMAALGANLDNLVRDTFLNSVGDTEITERLTAASNMIYNAPEEIKQTFMDWYGPASDAALMIAFLDPDDEWGGDWVNVRKTVESATIGGAAAITLDETITKQRAEAITALGRTQESVWTGFANLKLEEDLYRERIGEANLELGTHGTSIEFGMKGDLVEGELRTGQELADMIAARKARRASDFAGGGGALMSGSATGFGAANA